MNREQAHTIVLAILAMQKGGGKDGLHHPEDMQRILPWMSSNQGHGIFSDLEELGVLKRVYANRRKGWLLLSHGRTFNPYFFYEVLRNEWRNMDTEQQRQGIPSTKLD